MQKKYLTNFQSKTELSSKKLNEVQSHNRLIYRKIYSYTSFIRIEISKTVMYLLF
jgi:hypothetical protein